ncbi:unnamed protein product [Schistocephalus solidus]|uniref:Ig-like domain-containing protein n=1 Tax=Schistocephalus solidus TaxID=70667 RepID=A0A3P7EBB6_SCHSO|nr:unnamed protein product [Schistocephalus solidus]
MDGTTVIELPTQGRSGFFQMSATGFSFFDTLQLNTSWTEERKLTTHVAQGSQVSSVQQFPEDEELQKWRVKAYQLSPPMIYPDAADGQLVTYEWSLPVAQNSLPPRRLLDKFWIIDVDKEPLDKLRAWIVSESVDQLELYVYFQHSNSRGIFSENSEANIELLEFGCSMDAARQSLANFTMEKLLFEINLRKLDVLEATKEIKVQLEVVLNSPLILDHLNCSPSTLKLVPVWLPDDAEAISFSTSPVHFEFMAPSDVASLKFRLFFTFNSTVREFPVSLPNPMREKVNPVFNPQTSELAWQIVAPQLKSVVEAYKVIVISTVLACGTTDVREISVRPMDNCTNEQCQTIIWTPEQLSKIGKILSNYTLGVSPQFAGFNGLLSSGQTSTVDFTLGKTEILVDFDEITKEPGENLQITCTAYVGTLKETQKEVRWLRSDRSQLPETVSSRRDPAPNADGYWTATLTIPKVEPWHDGDYGCFVEPPVEFFLHMPGRSVLFTLRVGSVSIVKVNTAPVKFGEEHVVTCRTESLKPDQSIRWYWYRPEDASFEAVEGARNGGSDIADRTSPLRIRALPDLQGTLVCAIIPSDWEFAEEQEVPYYAMVESIIVKTEMELRYAAGEI